MIADGKRLYPCAEKTFRADLFSRARWTTVVPGLSGPAGPELDASVAVLDILTEEVVAAVPKAPSAILDY